MKRYQPISPIQNTIFVSKDTTSFSSVTKGHSRHLEGYTSSPIYIAIFGVNNTIPFLQPHDTRSCRRRKSIRTYIARNRIPSQQCPPHQSKCYQPRKTMPTCTWRGTRHPRNHIHRDNPEYTQESDPNHICQ